MRYEGLLLLSEAQAAGGCFVVGDSDDVDSIAQQYLSELTNPVVVYHRGNRPRNCHGRVTLRRGVESHEEKDQAMTRASDFDIA